MNEPRTVAIAGLGLIGGSLARDLVARGVRVLGYDRDATTLQSAVADGIVHTPLAASLDGIQHADAFLIAVPVDAAADLLARAAPYATAIPLLTDAGSTKRSITHAALQLGLGDRFVGAHPLAGDHRSGWSAARQGLFIDARVYVCPTNHAVDDAVQRALQLWHTVGAHTEVLSVDEHDELLAWTSHLPQATATALWHALQHAGITPSQLGPGGRDMTRLAASPADLWTAIALDNAAHLAHTLAALQGELAALEHALHQRDPEAVRTFFTPQ